MGLIRHAVRPSSLSILFLLGLSSRIIEIRYAHSFAANNSARRGGAMDRKKQKDNTGGGFGTPRPSTPEPSPIRKQQQEEDEEDNKPLMSGGGQIYSKPSLYDLAFGYRNYESEVEFLTQAHCDHCYPSSATAGGPKRVLELAAGPSRHSITSLTMKDSPVHHVTALDLSEDMQQYGLDLARNALEEVEDSKKFLILNDKDAIDRTTASSTFKYICQDMRSFSLPQTQNDPYDSAWVLLGSMQHLQTNNDVISCLQSIHKSLTPKGTLIIELPHPQETFCMMECTKNSWEVPLDLSDGKQGDLRVIWGDEDDVFDPIRQVRDFTVCFELSTTTTGAAGSDDEDGVSSGRRRKGGGGVQKKKSKRVVESRVKEVVPMRMFTAQEMEALALCSGFEIVTMYGALDKDVSVHDDNDQAFRMVCVMRKKEDHL